MGAKKIVISKPFEKIFASLPENIREATYRKLEMFLHSISHPSLRVKKIKGTERMWEMRITMNYRLTFEIWDDAIFLRKIGTHEILSSP